MQPRFPRVLRRLALLCAPALLAGALSAVESNGGAASSSASSGSTTAGSPEAPAGARRIAVDLARVQGALDRKFDFCVGAGRANEGLRADWQQQLARVRRDCGFRYLRFHGLFTDDMGVVLRDAKGGLHYNWQYVDSLFDAMLGMGVKPFVELGFMPGALASGTHTIFWWRGNVTPPRDQAEWGALLRAFAEHAIARYGEDEVASWYFEVWNEPNLSGFWIGDTGGRSGEAWQAYARTEYFRLYETSARALKAVSPRLRVGGPATAGNAWVPETIAFCTEKQVPLDFISTHNYSVMSGYLDETGSAGTVFAPNRDSMTREIRGTRAQIAASAKPGLELHYTEWSASYTPSDPIHDSYHSAAFILNKIKGVGGDAQSMSYWTFTDIFEEAGPRASAFHGGFGLLNTQGIPKPAFFAFQFLHRLGERELVNADADSFVTTDAHGGLQVLLWDFTVTHPGPSVIDQEYYVRDLPPEPAGTVSVRAAGLRPGVYQLARYKVGYRANDAHTAWLALGRPAQLSRAQVSYLCAQASGEPESVETVRIGENGVLQTSVELRQNDVVELLLSPL